MQKTGLCCLMALVLSGCQVESTDNNNQTGATPGTGNSTTPPPLSCSLADQHQQLARLLTVPTVAQDTDSSQGIYYELGTVLPVDSQPSTLSLPKLMLQVRPNSDEWSRVSTRTLDSDPYAALHQSLGMRWEPIADASSTALRVLYVYPGSPAALAGVQRGMTISQINGLPVPEYIPTLLPVSPDLDLQYESFQDQVTALLEGSTTRLTTVDGDLTAVRPATVQSYSPVFLPAGAQSPYILSDGRKVGYFYLDAFYATEASLVWLFNRLRAQGVTELVIDLRNNGGGRVDNAHLLAQLIVGSNYQGSLFNRLEFNPWHNSKTASQTFNLSAFSSDVQNAALQLNQVVFLTSKRTASASELLINGLAPHIKTVVIGEASAGKPYGMMPVEICGNTVFPISFINLNANLAPIPTTGVNTGHGCSIPDIADVNRPLGYIGSASDSNDGEVMLERALNYLDKGGCFAL